MRHLLAARQYLPTAPLIVTITADAFIQKGDGRPVFTANERAECLAAFAVVDFVAIVEGPTAIPALRIIHPRYYVKGDDYKGTACPEFDEARAGGAEIVYTPRYFSSTALIARLREVF